MEKKIKELDSQRSRSVNHIIMNNITDTEVISEEFEKLLDCIEDKRFYNQFWKLIQYTETFDTYITAEFRRAEKVLTTGE